VKPLFTSILFLTFLSLNPVLAETITVSGDVSGTWSADTVLVVGDIELPAGLALTIVPGVIVIFDGYYSFTINSGAVLTAVGTSGAFIHFTASNPETGWGGLNFLSASDESLLEYCFIEYGYKTFAGGDVKGGGLYIYSNSLTVSHCFIKDCAIECHEGGYYGYGGGIYCESAELEVLNCVFIGNTANNNYSEGFGGAIVCDNSNVTINGSIFMSCVADGGGAIYSFTNELYISNNIFTINEATEPSGGGAIHVRNDNIISVISNNTFTGNFCTGYEYGRGGAIKAYSHVILINNQFRYNHTTNVGGAISSMYGGGFDALGNTFVGNQAYRGGAVGNGSTVGFYLKNTFADNWHYFGGEGSVLYADGLSSAQLNSCLIWGNQAGPLSHYSSSGITVTYSDIQGSWFGQGNINADPNYLDPEHDDYRIVWRSPCIDTGDPDPLYNDPDSTRADMGAGYFDYSLSVNVYLTPMQMPYLIWPSGGEMELILRLVNIDFVAHEVEVWSDVALPDRTTFGPVQGPRTFQINPSSTTEIRFRQTVPGNAPFGIYHYNAYAVVDQDTSKDSFMFGKLGATTGGNDGWGNAGDPLYDIGGGSTSAHQATEFALFNAYPNAFNPATVIGFTLPEASLVRLEIFDVTGRLIESPLHGWRDAGMHEVTFDASHLASGIYIYWLEAGQFTASGKMVLIK
jgi:hypothetical protein